MIVHWYKVTYISFLHWCSSCVMSLNISCLATPNTLVDTSVGGNGTVTSYIKKSNHIINYVTTQHTFYEAIFYH